MKPSCPTEVIDALASARKPVALGHVTPDVDALGCMLAMARSMPCPDAAVGFAGVTASTKLRFLRELAGPVAIADTQRIADADLIIVLDTAVTKRIHIDGGWDQVADKTIVNIDHHISNTDFGTYNWVVDNASSTSEMVYNLIVQAGWPLDDITASMLYAGIYADTAGFTLPNATAEAFEVAAELVRAGADIEKLGARLYRSQAPHEFELIRRVYHNTHTAGDGRIAYSTLNYDEITGIGCTWEDIDDQVSIPRSLSGIRMAILLTEGEPGVVRINLRGENGTPVLEMAQKLGGGGHTYSAGVRMRGPFDDVVRRVLAEAESLINNK